MGVYAISVVVAFGLAWMLWPGSDSRGGSVWGRTLASFLAFCVTVSSLWRYSLPAPEGGINAFAVWVLCVVLIPLSGYVLGIVAYKIFRGAVVAKDLAAASAAQLADAAHQFADRNKTCPHCAETIKKEARVCKHCGRDV